MGLPNGGLGVNYSRSPSQQAKADRLAKDLTLFAFYDFRGVGFLMYQDAEGKLIERGVVALMIWRAKGCPTVTSWEHARQLGLTDF